MCFLTACPSQQQKNLTQQQSESAKFGLSEAKTTLPAATQDFSAPLNFFQALLSGDRNTVMDALNPAISSLTSQYDTGKAAAEEFAPRGGGRSAALEELPFQKAGTIATMVEGAQQTGATGVADIASMLANLGLGELGTGAAIAGQAVGELQNQTQISQSAGASSGAAIGSLIALLAA